RQHLDPAPLAPPAPAARELDPMGKQHVLQRRAALYPQHLAQRQQLQMDELAHGARFECGLLILAGGKIDFNLLSFEIIPAPRGRRHLFQPPPNSKMEAGPSPLSWGWRSGRQKAESKRQNLDVNLACGWLVGGLRVA